MRKKRDGAAYNDSAWIRIDFGIWPFLNILMADPNISE